MKIKSLIKLICLLVIVAALGVWAFGANVTLFRTKFIAWDKNMFKGNDIGFSSVSVYTITAPDSNKDLDTNAAAINAVEVFKKRAELMGYANASIRLMGSDSVFVALPLNEAQVKGGIGLFSYNGKLNVTKSAETVFTEKDVKSAKITGYNADYSALCVDVVFNNDAKAKLQELTSNGSYTFTFAMDTDVAKTTLKGSDVIRNGKVTLEFPVSDANAATVFEYCINSGSVDGKIEWSETSDYISGTAGENAMFVLAMCALAIILVAALYYIVSNKMLGLAAALSTFIGAIAYEFFTATFSWINVDAGAVAGIVVGLLITIFAHILVLNNVSRQYALGKDVISSLDSGVKNAQSIIFELCLVAAVLGIGLWIAGAGFASFGIALLGGAIVAVVTSVFVLKFVAKIFVGLGADSAKALGLKRGE